MKDNAISIIKSGIRLMGVAFMCLLLINSFSSCGHDNRDDLSHNHSHAHHEEEGHDHSEEEEHEHGEHVSGEKHNSDEIIIMPEVADRMGVYSDTVAVGNFYETISVGGEIVSSSSSLATVSSPSSGTVTFSSGINDGTKVGKGQTVATVNSRNQQGGDVNAVALAAMNAAKRELDRITPLHADGIVSTKDYNAALQAYETAKAAYSPEAATGRAISPISGTITRLLVNQGQFVNAGEPIAEVSSATSLSLRADLPDRKANLLNKIESANFRTAYSDEWHSIRELNGKKGSSIGGSGTASGVGYSPIYFTFDNPGTLVPGTYAEVQLLGSPREGVLSVPAEALSEQQGTLFVYVKTGDHSYEKRMVKTGGNDGRSVEITEGLHPGEQIVVKGASIVKLAESSGVVPEGHSHNH